MGGGLDLVVVVYRLRRLGPCEEEFPGHAGSRLGGHSGGRGRGRTGNCIEIGGAGGLEEGRGVSMHRC